MHSLRGRWPVVLLVIVMIVLVSAIGYRLSAQTRDTLSAPFERQVLGKTGEDLAAAELERRGYAIVARRYRTKHGEIDIVARDRDTVVFVEVKARATAEFGTAVGSLVSILPPKLASSSDERSKPSSASRASKRVSVG